MLQYKCAKWDHSSIFQTTGCLSLRKSAVSSPSSLLLPHFSQASVSHNRPHMNKTTRTHSHTQTHPEHKCQPIFHILFPKMSVPRTKRICLPALLAVSPRASCLNLLSPLDISHARGHRTYSPTEYS